MILNDLPKVWAPTPENLARAVPRLDSAETVSIARDLLYVFAKMYEVRRTPLRARAIIPISYEVPTGASSFAVQASEGHGTADFSNDGDPVQYVDETQTEEIRGIKTCRSGYRYTLQEQRGDELSRRGRLARLGNRARRAVEEQLNGLAFNGSGAMEGLLNANGVSNAAATNGTWTGASLDQILRDVTDHIDLVRSQSDGEFRVTRYVLPSVRWGLLRRQRFSTDTSALKWLMMEFPEVEFTWATELDTAGTGGTPMAIAFENNVDHVALVIPQEFEVLRPIDKADHLEFLCRLRTGGVAWHEPLCAAQIYGI